MSVPVFFRRGPGLSVAEIAERTGAKVAASTAGTRRLTDIAAIERAGPDDITFADGPAAQDDLRLTHAGACFMRSEPAQGGSRRTTILLVDDPYKAFVEVATALYPDAQLPSSLFDVRGIAVSALIHPSARIEAGVTIDPAAMVGPRAEIGAGTHVGPMAVVGPEVRIGRNCSLGPGASLTNTLVGDGVVIEAGCRIGSARESNRPLAKRGPRLGRAILQDKVVVGANSVIDRGSERDTIIGEGTMIDTLVQIPADALVGRYCRVSAGAAPEVHGSTELDADGLQLFALQLVRTDAPKIGNAGK